MIARHLIFVGRVQGVGFRFTAYHIANRHKLTGFVRNLPDGTVEMLAQGNPDQVGDCIREIQDSFTGYVRDTRMEDVAPDPQYGRFNITF